VRGTLRAIEDRLSTDEELVLPYETEEPSEGLPTGEAAFWRFG